MPQPVCLQSLACPRESVGQAWDKPGQSGRESLHFYAFAPFEKLAVAGLAFMFAVLDDDIAA